MILFSLPISLSLSLIALALGGMLIIKAKRHREFGTLFSKILGYIVVTLAILSVIGVTYSVISIMTIEREMMFSLSTNPASWQMQKQKPKCRHIKAQNQPIPDTVNQTQLDSDSKQKSMMNDQISQNGMGMVNGSSMMNKQMPQNHMNNGSSMMTVNDTDKKTDNQTSADADKNGNTKDSQ